MNEDHKNFINFKAYQYQAEILQICDNVFIPFPFLLSKVTLKVYKC